MKGDGGVVSEKRMWKVVRDAIRGKPARGARIEAGRGEAEPGTPDVVLSYLDRTRWIELKVWPNKMRREQVSWARLHDLCDCAPVLVLVRRRKVYYLFRWDYYGGEGTEVQWDRALWTGHPRDGMLESL